MTSNAKPETALKLVYDWAKDRPAWLSDGIRQIINDGLPSEEKISELADICMAAHGLREARPAEPLGEYAEEEVGVEQNPVSLTCISNVEGVNQLASQQTVDFGSSDLTIIYGPNGAGKSGYTRILKRACNARNRGEIMPNAFAEANGESARARIGNRQNGEENSLHWTDSDVPTPELQTVSIFDRECAATHLSQKNTVLFRPFGLDIPDDLAAVCNKVKAILEEEKKRFEERRDPIFDNPIWSATSDIGGFLNDLTYQSRIENFPNHPDLSEEEIAKLARLQKDLASNPDQTAATYQRNAHTLEQFVNNLVELATQFDDSSLLGFVAKKTEAKLARSAAIAAAEQAFAKLEFSGVGEDVWRRLWESARKYSETQSSPQRNFPPQEGDPCVLCHQPISATAAKRMVGFEEFILADTEAAAESLENLVQEQKRGFEIYRIEFRQYAPELTILNEHVNRPQFTGGCLV